MRHLSTRSNNDTAEFVPETVEKGEVEGSQSCATPHENWRRNIQAIRYTSITFNRTLRFPAAKEMEKSSVPYNLFHQNQPPCQPAKSPRKPFPPFPPSLCHFFFPPPLLHLVTSTSIAIQSKRTTGIGINRFCCPPPAKSSRFENEISLSSGNVCSPLVE